MKNFDPKNVETSGAEDVYGFLRTNLLGNLNQAFLSQKIDEKGRATTFIYAPYNPTNTAVVLSYIIDADRGTNTVSYTSVAGVCNYLISNVTDRYGRSVNMVYDEN